MGSHQQARFRGLIKEQTPFEKHGKQSTGRHCCPHFDRSNLAYPSAYIWSLSGPHPAARGVEIQMLSHLCVLRGVYSEQIYRTTASVLSGSLAHSPLSRSSTATLTSFLNTHTFSKAICLLHHFSIAVGIYALCVCELNSLSSLICWYWFSQMYTWHTLLSRMKSEVIFCCFMHTLLHKIYILFRL